MRSHNTSKKFSLFLLGVASELLTALPTSTAPHFEKAFSLLFVTALLKKSCTILLTFLSDFTSTPPSP